MNLPSQTVAEILQFAFNKAFREKDHGLLKGSNPFRSTYFVSLIGDELKKHFTDAETHYQAIESIYSEKKIGGEWLFDICVTSQLPIEDSRYIDGKAIIDTNILFACESEFGTGLKEFATDFGKLICSNANQYLYIQGLNQSTEAGRNEFINARKDLIRLQLRNLIKDDFVLAFIPTPGKRGESSFWDTHEKEILSWASIWIYDVSEREFLEYDKR